MILKSLFLTNFRNFPQKEPKLASETTLILGPNTSGKTNLLEAIYLLATGKSFRAGVEKEMIRYEKEIARVKGEVKDKEEVKDLEIVLTPGQVRGERTAKKRCLLNGVGKRMMDFVGNLRCVLFGPEDLEIVVNSPSIRRDYLDSVLEQVDRDYRRASLSYQKGLRQRNRLLEQIRERGRPKSSLFFWNKLLVENGEIISQKREEFINFVNAQPDYFYDLVVFYHKSIVSPLRLEKFEEREIAAGMTLVGPHRDDFELGVRSQESGVRSLHAFGSRGEQRTAVFSLKLAELEFVARKTAVGGHAPTPLSAEGGLYGVAEKSEDPSTDSGRGRPVLLLDDIFSELDHTRRKRLVEVIPRQQTIITATDIHLIEPAFRRQIKVVELK